MPRPKSNRICSVVGCGKPHKSKGYCRNHWRKFCKTEGSTITKKCGVAGCEKAHYAKGHCRKHYRQVNELGYAEPVPDNMLCKECNKAYQGRPDSLFCSHSCQMKWHRREGCYTDDAMLENYGRCKHEGCRGGKHAKGYCKKHYLRWHRHGDPEGGLPDEAPICSKDGCGQVAGRVSGLCPRHYHNEYYHANHDVERARRNARRSRVKDATPPWADMAEIRAIYENCPEGHEVDHIIPLKGAMVSGLHVPENLQYLPVGENRTKSNAYTAELTSCGITKVWSGGG